jgi:hypothetical protein
MCLEAEKKFDKSCHITDERIGKENMLNIFNLKIKQGGDQEGSLLTILNSGVSQS